MVNAALVMGGPMHTFLLQRSGNIDVMNSPFHFTIVEFHVESRIASDSSRLAEPEASRTASGYSCRRRRQKPQRTTELLRMSCAAIRSRVGASRLRKYNTSG